MIAIAMTGHLRPILYTNKTLPTACESAASLLFCFVFSFSLSLTVLYRKALTASVFFSDTSHNYELIRCSAALFAGCMLIICN